MANFPIMKRIPEAMAPGRISFHFVFASGNTLNMTAKSAVMTMKEITKLTMKNTTTGSTDHASFRPTFLAIGLTEEYTSGDTTPYYHKAGDTFDTVNFPYLLSTTVLVNQVVADLTR